MNAAQELYSNGLITQDTHRDVTTQHNQPTHRRASSLLAAINSFIDAFPEKEHSVLKMIILFLSVCFSFLSEVIRYHASCSRVCLRMWSSNFNLERYFKKYT